MSARHALVFYLLINVCFTLFIFLLLEPNDTPPVLLIANSDTIEVLYLNGTRASTLGSVRGSGIQTLDFIHSKDIVCWTESKQSSSQLKCTEISKTGVLTDEWVINTIPYLHSKYLNLGMYFFFSLYKRQPPSFQKSSFRLNAFIYTFAVSLTNILIH